MQFIWLDKHAKLSVSSSYSDDDAIFWLDNRLLHVKRYGFIKGRSTSLQLLHIMDKWTEYLEQGGQIGVMYSDFEKAFDKVYITG